MNEPERQIMSLLGEAVEHSSPEERAAFLDRACAGDAGRRARLEELLRAHEAAGNFLQGNRPPAEPVTTVDEPIREGPGTVIGPYKLLEQIGEGGFGVVFMAEQTRPVRRKVALKVLKPGMDTRQVVARFEAERQALAIMDHPNIAKVHDGGETASGRPYFVMELVKGTPITEFCDRNHLPVRERLELFLSICQAVQHAHQKGVIHRDLKPSNVLVTRHDTMPIVKVIDFGVAKALGQNLTDKTLFTGIAQMIGTPLYMSPEQAGMSDLDIDTRSDIYSLGVLLYELLTGTTPFDPVRLRTAGYDEMRRIIREQEPPRPSTRLSTLGQAATTASSNRKCDPRRLSQLLRGDLDWIVMKALEKDRNGRYETANGFAMDIQRYLADEPVQACPPSAWYRLRKLVRRHKGPVVAASAIFILLGAGIVGTTTGLVRAITERNEKDAARRQAIDAAEAEAEARRQTRRALDTATDEVVGELLGQQVQLTEQHREFLKKLLAYHAAFAAAKADDREGRESQAAGYFRVALIRQRLGELKGAEAAYREALAIGKQLVADFPDESAFRTELAYHENNLGLVLRATGRLPEAEALCRDALALRKELAAESPGEPKPRYLLATTYRNLGSVLADTGRLPEAEAAFGEVLTICKKLAADFPETPNYRWELALGHQKLGVLLASTGRLPEAEAAFRDALAVSKPLAASFPNRPDYRHAWALDNLNLGNVLRDTGHPGEAERAFRDSVAILRRLAADFPNRPEFRHALGTVSNNLANLLSTTGQPEEAERVLNDAVALLKQLVADYPNRPDFRSILATSHNSLGSLLLDLKRSKEAEAEFREAVALRKQLAAAFAKQPDFRRLLALDQYNLAEVLCATGRQKEGETMLQDALELQKRLTADFANVPDYQNDLAGTLKKLAALRCERRDFPAAVSLVEQARPHQQAALKASPTNDVYRQSYREDFTILAECYVGLADRARLAATADELADFGYDPAKDAYDAACYLCRCAGLAAGDSRIAETERKESAKRYADRAVSMLRRAVASGYRDEAQMKRDPTLQPLRAREDFKKLLAELAAGRGKK
jgi:serine/threonine protein kinase/tetratricopeptide (TPR) repeat protein